jgi:hypothetical protein
LPTRAASTRTLLRVAPSGLHSYDAVLAILGF